MRTVGRVLARSESLWHVLMLSPPTHNLVVVGSSTTLPTSFEFLTYPQRVTEQQLLHDDCDVDVAQIGALSRLSPAERLAHMVDVVNTMQEIRDHSQAARS